MYESEIDVYPNKQNLRESFQRKNSLSKDNTNQFISQKEYYILWNLRVMERHVFQWKNRDVSDYRDSN